MKKIRFMKFYNYVLLPLYLIICLWVFINYMIAYGLPVPNVNVPISCTITIAFTEIAYLIYIPMLIYLLIKFENKNQKVYNLNIIALFLFPFIQLGTTLITSVISYEMNRPTNASFLSFLIAYAFVFCPFFLPQVIYFKKRKSLFVETGNNNEDC